MTLPVLAPARPVLTPPSHLGSPPRPACPHQAKATSSGPPSSKMSASGFLYFLFLLLGSAPSSRTQALSPTTSEFQLTSRDPVKDGEDTGQTQPENKMETTSAMGNLEPRTVTSRTNPQTPSISSGEEWNPFKSNEYTLRKRGLIAAALLFITGILILTSDRCRQFRWCRRQQRSAYRVSQA
ncbi:FXYD domain-containing ion transport regulator 5 isoform X5 [Petaurus breviceps papuanus]|uniref:FXYD domain-containing ion transport regulator 5 isoform X5 n=1 Tax=Petaurus breviceps papuanus TaxID=3040969 RepID=UPI0036DCA5E5